MVQVATSCPQKKNNEIKCTDHLYELCIRGAKATAPHFWAMPDFVTKLEYYTNLEFRDYACPVPRFTPIILNQKDYRSHICSNQQMSSSAGYGQH